MSRRPGFSKEPPENTLAFPEPQAKKQVGIWVRVSTEDQVRGESPEHHELRARMYAESRGWEVARLYRLEAVSGKTVKEHPEARRMQEDVRSGAVTGLIFSKLARLARNTRELLEFAEFFKAHEADLVSLHESVDTSTPAGRFFYTMIAGMAQWEREEIADRVAASVPVRAKLGKQLGGTAPFGYRWVDKRLVPNPEEAPVRKLIYELFVRERRLRAVARILNESGHRTRKGFAFTYTTVRGMIEDPTPRGLHRANYIQNVKYRSGAWRYKPESEWVLQEVEPIVSQELWEEANALLRERKSAKKRPARKAVHLFAGVARCHCGHKMYVPTNTPKYVCFGCRNKIPIADLEAVFAEELRGFFLSGEEVAGHLAAADRAIGEKRELLQVMEREAERLRGESDKLYRLYLDGNLSSAGFGERNRPIEDRLAQLGEEIPRLQGEIDYLVIQHRSGGEILAEAADLYRRWGDLAFEEKRTIVEQVVERVVVGKSDLEIALAYLPSSSEIMAQRPRNRTG